MPPVSAAGRLCPALGAGGKSNSEGLSGESRWGLFPALPKVTGTDAHTPGSYTELACAGRWVQSSE